MSQLLGLVVGLIFFYLLLSLLVSAFWEAVAGFSGLRGKTMERAICRMLDGTATKQAPSSLSARFLDAAPYQRLRRLSLNGKHPPSYLAPANFAQLLLGVLELPDEESKQVTTGKLNLNQLKRNIEAVPDEGTRNILFFLLEKAGGDIDKFLEGLEQWFIEMMDRVSGWYKRKTQLWLFVTGLIVAIAINGDTLAIAKGLLQDESRRAGVEKLAEAYASQALVLDSLGGSADFETVRERWNELAPGSDAGELLGLGWESDWPRLQGIEGTEGTPYALWVLQKLGGWAITALAVSLGAPFWFDLLNRIMDLRYAGRRPTTEAQK
ncbi:MAG: hypothetical protein AAGI38_08615 [Bacteroidota bacterium]